MVCHLFGGADRIGLCFITGFAMRMGILFCFRADQNGSITLLSMIMFLTAGGFRCGFIAFRTMGMRRLLGLLTNQNGFVFIALISVQMLLKLRQGANQLLPYIDFENIKRHPKRIVSYSDGTFLLNPIWAQTGLETYYGQAPHNFLDMTWYDEKHFFEHMVYDCMREHVANSEWKVQTHGRAEGILIGGYARNFAMILGSKYMPVDYAQKYILFVEDHESFGGVDYVSAMLTHIEQDPFMDCVTGVIFGNYSGNENWQLLWRLQRLGEERQIPVVYCDDFGHGWNHAIMPIGRKASLDTEREVPFILF